MYSFFSWIYVHVGFQIRLVSQLCLFAFSVANSQIANCEYCQPGVSHYSHTVLSCESQLWLCKLHLVHLCEINQRNGDVSYYSPLVVCDYPCYCNALECFHMFLFVRVCVCWCTLCTLLVLLFSVLFKSMLLFVIFFILFLCACCEFSCLQLSLI